MFSLFNHYTNQGDNATKTQTGATKIEKELKKKKQLKIGKPIRDKKQGIKLYLFSKSGKEC